MIGQWALDHEETWKKNGANPEMSDLFLWHLAEEVEHRNVAFDLFQHLLSNKAGFYLSRQVIMTAVFPIFIYFLVQTAQSLAQQDSDQAVRKKAQVNILRMLIQLDRIARRDGNIPSLGFLTKSVVRWLSPNYHPEHEGNTEQALAYFARSKAVQSAKRAS